MKGGVGIEYHRTKVDDCEKHFTRADNRELIKESCGEIVLLSKGQRDPVWFNLRMFRITGTSSHGLVEYFYQRNRDETTSLLPFWLLEILGKTSTATQTTNHSEDYEMNFEIMNSAFTTDQLKGFIRSRNEMRRQQNRPRLLLKGRKDEVIKRLLEDGFNPHENGATERRSQKSPHEVLHDMWFMRPLSKTAAMESGSYNEQAIPFRLQKFIEKTTRAIGNESLLVYFQELGIACNRTYPWLGTSVDGIATIMCLEKHYADDHAGNILGREVAIESPTAMIQRIHAKSTYERPTRTIAEWQIFESHYPNEENDSNESGKNDDNTSTGTIPETPVFTGVKAYLCEFKTRTAVQAVEKIKQIARYHGKLIIVDFGNAGENMNVALAKFKAVVPDKAYRCQLIHHMATYGIPRALYVENTSQKVIYCVVLHMMYSQLLEYQEVLHTLTSPYIGLFHTTNDSVEEVRQHYRSKIRNPNWCVDEDTYVLQYDNLENIIYI